jgi:hypothetical protein
MNSVEDSDQRPISRAKAWEESWPYLFGICVATVYGVWGSHLPLSPNLKDAFVAVAGVAGIFAAFFLTSASILVTLRDSWFLRRAMESGVYTSLVGYLLTAMGWSLAVAIITIAGIFFDASWHLWWYRYALIGWAFLLATTLAVSVRVLRIFASLLKYTALR